MSSSKTSLAIALLLLTNLVTLGVWVLGDKPSSTNSSQGSGIAVDSEYLGQIEAKIDGVSEALADLTPTLASSTGRSTSNVSDATGVDVSPILDRLTELDDKLLALSEKLDALEVGGVEQVAVDFGAEDGYVHATKLLDDKKYGTAAEGFLEFAAKNPDHPDRVDFMNKARWALTKAGFHERAIDLQKEIIETDSANLADNQSTLARLLFERKQYDQAIASMDVSIKESADQEAELWRRMYRAWYIEVRDGPAAGVAAYEEVNSIRESYGVVNDTMVQRITKKVQELQNRRKG